MDREDSAEMVFENMQKMYQTNRKKLRGLLRQRDISLSQMELLRIVKHQQPISAKAIAKRMDLTPGAITQILEQLRHKAYIRREEDERDRRSSNIFLSDAGAAALREVHKQRRQLLRDALKTLSSQELAVMLQAQKKMIERIEQQINQEEE